MAHITCNFISYTLRRAVDINVIIPTLTIPESFEGSPEHIVKAKYPVIYLLHGYGNDYSTWERYTSIERYAEERRIAVVTLSGENKAYRNIPNGDQYYTFISKELPELIYGLFPISSKPEDTYIAGLSMGGYGTLLHALSQPERYCAFGAFSPAVDMVVNKKDGDLLTEEEKNLKPSALAKKISAEGGKFPKAYISCGTEDFLYNSVISFKDELIALGAHVTWDSVEGYGHEWAFWDDQIKKFMDWIPRTDSYYLDKPKRKI